MEYHPLNCCMPVQVSAIIHRSMKTILCLSYNKRDIELCSCKRILFRYELHIAQSQRRNWRHVLKYKHDLENRCTAHIPFLHHSLNYFFEWNFQMLISLESGLPYFFEDVFKRTIPVYFRAKCECVNKKSNEVLQLVVLSACYRRSDADVFLIAVTMDQYIERA